MKISASLLLGFSLLSSNLARADFVAYNDLAGFSPPNATSIGLSGSGLLKDYDTGTNTSVMLQVSGYLVSTLSKPEVPDYFAGGDALAEFDQKIISDDFIKESADSPDAWVNLDFSGLDPNKLYTVVVTGNRGANPNRTAKFTISGVDSFVNQSSIGAPWTGPDWVEFDTGVNTDTGYVARFADIRVGSDGQMRITVTPGPHNGDRNKFFLNQLKLTEIPEPGALGMLCLGGLLLMLRRR